MVNPFITDSSSARSSLTHGPPFLSLTHGPPLCSVPLRVVCVCGYNVQHSTLGNLKLFKVTPCDAEPYQWCSCLVRQWCSCLALLGAPGCSCLVVLLPDAPGCSCQWCSCLVWDSQAAEDSAQHPGGDEEYDPATQKLSSEFVHELLYPAYMKRFARCGAGYALRMGVCPCVCLWFAYMKRFARCGAGYALCPAHGCVYVCALVFAWVGEGARVL